MSLYNKVVTHIAPVVGSCCSPSSSRYVDAGTLLDPIIVHTDPAAAPFLKLKEKDRPEGFKRWREFGGPPGAPGQVRHHPAIKEHEMIGYVIAMHFLTALEVIAADVVNIERGRVTFDKVLLKANKNTGRNVSRVFEHRSFLSRALPKPVTAYDESEIGRLMVGHGNLQPMASDGTDQLDGERNRPWTMNRIECRTSFDPIVLGSLSEIVVSGTFGDDIDPTLPKGQMFYSRGWVLDYGETEKKAKQALKRYGGLGYIDSKKAYYGIQASGNLTLVLPGGNHRSFERFEAAKNRTRARDWFRSIVICEVNENRGKEECRLAEDLNFYVGEVKVPSVRIVEAEGAAYLGKKICVAFAVPQSASLLTSHFLEEEAAKTSTGGLKVEISVRNPKVSVKSGACSVSHVVWEQE